MNNQIIADSHQRPIELRPYQYDIVDAAITHFKESTDPIIIDACVGAGKTLMISHIARHVVNKGGRVISLAHTKELVEGACKTFQAYAPDMEVGIFSAAIGRKDTGYDVTYATEKSLVNSLALFDKINLLILDEAHRVNDRNDKTCYMKIINHFMTLNPKLRVLGLTGTAFRLGTGSIVGRKRFFKQVIASVTALELIDQGFLTKPVAPVATAGSYNFSGVQLVGGKYKESCLQEAVNDDRLTKAIIEDVMEQTAKRNKVLIFASTLRHAQEIISYLPEGTAGYLDGTLPKKQREGVLRAFSDGKIKYLVNKDILTTGYDEPAIDAIAILRPTESRGLLIQMIGRVLRLHPSKTDALILDYAENISKHGGGSLDDVFLRESKSADPQAGQDGEKTCPDCGATVSESARKCKCGYYFICSVCPDCGTQNDVTRRYCFKCDYELIDPNSKLSLRANSSDSFDVLVRGMKIESYVKNKETLRITFDAEKIGRVSQFFVPGSRYTRHFISKATRTYGSRLDRMTALTPKELTSFSHLFRCPASIKCKQDGQFYKVVGWEF